MSKVDQFESVFRSAAKDRFVYEEITVDKILVVTDLEKDEANAFLASIRSFLEVLSPGSPEWRAVSGSEYGTIKKLLDLVQAEGPSLICTYRNLHSSAWKWPHSLGEYVDVMTQATSIPVMVLPHPKAERAAGHSMKDTNMVMAITSHLTGDRDLVSRAYSFTQDGGTLFLSHIEDQPVFERYLEVISRIPDLDTETARSSIEKQLLKEPHDYVSSCREVFQGLGRGVSVEEVVRFGHRLREYERLVEEHAIDLLVLHTKDEDQLAMHGLAYPLAVEMRQIPLLMI